MNESHSSSFICAVLITTAEFDAMRGVFHKLTVEKKHKTPKIFVSFTGTFPWCFPWPMHIDTQVNKPFFSGRVFKISTSYIVYTLCLELEHNELRISAVQMFTDSTKRVISQDFTLFTSH